MANPGVRLRSDEEIMDCYNSQSGKSKAFLMIYQCQYVFFINSFTEGLTTFIPGKISSKFTDRFEIKDQSGSKCRWQMEILSYC